MLNHERNITRSEELQKNTPFFRPSKFVLIICLLLLIIPSLYQIKPAYSLTVLVPTEYPTIQDAVNNATAGDTIQVAPGVYPEHVVVTKSLTIIGENPQTTIVDGTANGTVFDLEASNVYITGFTIRNAGNGYNAITSERETVTNDDHQIVNNIITSSQFGVSLSYSKSNTIFNNTFINNPLAGIFLNKADNTNITANTILESAYGIKMMFSTNVIIIGNTISQTSYAVYLSASSTGNTIRRNNLSGQTVGVFSSSDSTTVDHNTITEGAYGIYFYNSIGGSIYYNTLENNSYGIRIYMSPSATSSHNVNNNKILNTDWAIELTNANGNTFTGNWLQQNTYGIFLFSSSSNTAYHNNFIQNNIQASAGIGGGNLWDKFGEGNYWSDYTGIDANGDGIGDTSYRITPIGRDYFPLMTTWSEHDILIANVSTSTNRTYPGSTVNINATVKNIGKAGTSETFDVTLKINELPIETKPVTDLAPDENQTLTFNWNTAGSIPGTNYTISVEASPVPDELNTDNNKLIDGKVYIKPTGDVNDDGIVDIFDICAISAHWYPGPPAGPLGYAQEADLNDDGNVDILDIEILSGHMGETP